MIIGACGLGETGSSAITDYLKEFDSIIVNDDFEFNYVASLDGLIDLEKAVMYPHSRTTDSIYAIMRFLEMVERRKRDYRLRGLSPNLFEESAKRFVDAITMVKWYWTDSRKKNIYDIGYIIRKIIQKKYVTKWEIKNGKRYNGWPMTEVRLSVKPDNFYEAAKTHIDEMLKGLGVDQENVVALDQPFPGNNPQACFPFFKDPYAIVVDRDPRDLYVYSKTKLMGKMRFFPIDTVEDFIVYYKCMRKNQPYLQNHPRILRIRFEDLVYEYENTTTEIRDFLHLPLNPRPKSVFDPSLSIVNTQVFKRDTRFSEDVKKIEEMMPEYLFDFSKYAVPDFNKQMFVGRSPLNKKSSLLSC